jgi:hypothetical protein
LRTKINNELAGNPLSFELAKQTNKSEQTENNNNNNINERRKIRRKKKR